MCGWEWILLRLSSLKPGPQSPQRLLQQPEQQEVREE